MVLFGAIETRAEGLVAVTSTNVLCIRFDSATPGTVSQVAITGLQAGEVILGLDRRSATGELYGLGSTSRLYRNRFNQPALQLRLEARELLH